MKNTQKVVAIKNARFYAPIGFYEEERLLGNEFYVDTEAWLPISDGNSENLENTLNYEEIYDILANTMARKRKLLESAASEVLQQLTTSHTQITKIIISIRKINPPFGGDSSQSEVRLIYEKD